MRVVLICILFINAIHVFLYLFLNKTVFKSFLSLSIFIFKYLKIFLISQLYHIYYYAVYKYKPTVQTCFFYLQNFITYSFKFNLLLLLLREIVTTTRRFRTTIYVFSVKKLLIFKNILLNFSFLTEVFLMHLLVTKFIETLLMITNN